MLLPNSQELPSRWINPSPRAANQRIVLGEESRRTARHVEKCQRRSHAVVVSDDRSGVLQSFLLGRLVPAPL